MKDLKRVNELLELARNNEKIYTYEQICDRYILVSAYIRSAFGSLDGECSFSIETELGTEFSADTYEIFTENEIPKLLEIIKQKNIEFLPLKIENLKEELRNLKEYYNKLLEEQNEN